MRRENPKMPDLGGEKTQFIQSSLQGRIIGMTLDLGVELGGGECAPNLIALKLGHVHAVGGEAAHRLVQS